MPYNNTAIPPSEEITGSASLPLARVKKILHVDDDLGPVSANAAFAITVATEMFIRYMAEQAMNVVKTEKRPRRNLQYKDLANAVARIDNLQFLEDVIPQTSTYREYKTKKARKAQETAPLQNGQTTLDAPRPIPRPSTAVSDPHTEAMDNSKSDGTAEEDATARERSNGPPRTNGRELKFEHYEPNGSSRRDGSGDIEMD